LLNGDFFRVFGHGEQRVYLRHSVLGYYVVRDDGMVLGKELGRAPEFFDNDVHAARAAEDIRRVPIVFDPVAVAGGSRHWVKMDEQACRELAQKMQDPREIDARIERLLAA
jgi:hypothetical protein